MTSPPPPPLPLIPTTEEVMEELQQVTRLYTSCDDPIESAARKQRVLVSDAQGLMEETAQGIIIAAQKAQAAQTQLQEEILDHALIILLPAKPTNTIGSSTQQPTTGITGKKRGRPARTRDLRISQKRLLVLPLADGSCQASTHLREVLLARRVVLKCLVVQEHRAEGILFERQDRTQCNSPLSHPHQMPRHQETIRWIFTGEVLLFLSCTQLELLWVGEPYNSPAD